MVTPGDVLADRYHLEGRIASGGMGDVWYALDGVLKRQVAVKLLRADMHADPTFTARFRAEARTLAALHHPGVVSVYDYGEFAQPDGSDLAYLVMAYIHGQPLSHRIADTGHLTPAETMAFVTQAAHALQAAHAAGVIHRDVKPDNLLIDADNNLVLVDFGVAQNTENVGLTGAKEIIGTALYMAPEQVTKRAISPATDIYALGAVAYHCLTGRPPFTGDNALTVALLHLSDDPAPLPDSVPASVRDVVTMAMAKDPADRYPSAAAMAMAAQSAMTGSLSATSVDAFSTMTGAAAVAGAATGAGTGAGAFAPGAAAARWTPPQSGSTSVLPVARRSRPRALPLALAACAIGIVAVAIALALSWPSTGGGTDHGGANTVPGGSTSPSHKTKQPTSGSTRSNGNPTVSPTPGTTSTPTTPASPVAPTTTKPAPGPTTTAPTATPTGGNGGGNQGGSTAPSGPPNG